MHAPRSPSDAFKALRRPGFRTGSVALAAVACSVALAPAATAATPSAAGARALANAVISGQYQPSTAVQALPKAVSKPPADAAAAAATSGAVATARRAARAAGAAAAPPAVRAVPARPVHTNSRYQAPVARPVARAARALRRPAGAREAEPAAPRNVNISIRIFSPGDDGDVTQVADAAERAAEVVLPLAREGGARFLSAAQRVRDRTSDERPQSAGESLNLTLVWGGGSASRATPAELRAALGLLEGALPAGDAAALRQAVRRAGGARGSPASAVLRTRAAAARKRLAARRARAARAAPSTAPVAATAPAVPAQASPPSAVRRRAAAAAAAPRVARRRGGGSRHAPGPDRRDAPAPPPGVPPGAGSAAGAGGGGHVSAPLAALPRAPALRLSGLSSRLPSAEVARRQEPIGQRLERPG